MIVGDTEGVIDGTLVFECTEVDLLVEFCVSSGEVAVIIGDLVGVTDGYSEGSTVETALGAYEGDIDGWNEGDVDGWDEGDFDGDWTVGFGVAGQLDPVHE